MKSTTRIIFFLSTLFLAVWTQAQNVDTGVYLEKTATYDYSTQQGTIKLESFVGQVTKVISPQPADVVLVLDLSSSMKNHNPDSRPLLKSAVTGFVNTLYDDYITNPSTKDHRVSIVFYGGSAQLKCDFQSVSEIKNTYSTLYRAINAITTTTISDTRPDYGLELARYVMAGTKTTKTYISGYPTGNLLGTTNERNHYVVLMTDGKADGGETAVITNSYNLKNHASYPSSVYCVAFLDNLSLSNTTRQSIAKQMNLISSNYPLANSTTYKTDYLPHDYYTEVNSSASTGTASSALTSIFEEISREVVAGCAAVDLVSAEVTDVINSGHFKLPDGVDETNINSVVSVYTVPCTAYSQTSTGQTYTFNESNKTPATGVSLVLSKDEDDNPMITVSGFDYTDNWCGLQYSGSGTTTTPHGKKLVIEIPFTVNGYDGAIGEGPTNVEGSGFKGEINGGGYLEQKFGSPVVDLYELTISRTGLKAGESAIYNVTDKDDNLLYTVVLTGTGGSGAVTQKVLYVPDGNVTVTETGWGWANRPSTATITNTISASNSKPTYSFSGSPSGTKNPEDYKKNEFNN